MKSLKDTFSELSNILGGLETEDEIYNFLRDLMTEEEMRECVRRWEISKLLNQGISYLQIEKKTGASSTTIARVQKYLKGKNQGYQKALQSLKAIAHPHHTDHGSRSG